MTKVFRYGCFAPCRAAVGTGAAVLPLFGVAGPAFAHAFGERYELPVPIWLFIVGGAVTVTVTFVAIALFVRADAARFAGRCVDISASPVGRLLLHRWVHAGLKAAGLLMLALALAAGFAGAADPHRNIAPTLVWIVGWTGLSYVAMLIGNPWPILNPWRTLADIFSRRCSVRVYPARLGAWPAVALLFAFGWIELIFPFSSTPAVLAWLLVAYSAVTLAGMARFGPRIWLENADPFHVAFDLIARFAPLGAARDGGIVIRSFAAGLLEPGRETVSTPIACFVLGLLSIVLFDGLLGSGHWTVIENAVHDLHPTMSDLSWIAIHSVALAAVWALFLGLFVFTCAAMRLAGGGANSTLQLTRAFALTLIPIAVGYHFAHTFQYLLVQGQGIVRLISDPLGFGWDLFGTRGYEIDLSIMNTKTAWYLAVSAIVIGHVVSVYLAHVVAVRTFATRTRVLAALVPMTVLMVIYTIVSLQILAEPLVKYSGPQETII